VAKEDDQKNQAIEGSSPGPSGSAVPLRLLRPGSRIQRRRSSHSYGFVLALLVLAFVFTAAAPDKAWAAALLVVIEGVTLLSAIWTSGLSGSRLLLFMAASAVLAIPGLMANGGSSSQGAANGVNALLLVVTCGAILSGIVDQGVVNVQSVLGSICVYLALGMIFTFIYGTVAQLGHADFFAEGTDGTSAIRLYFSFATLTTVGYGDYTAAANPGQTLAVVEALMGQIYLVTVVALIVGHLKSST